MAKITEINNDSSSSSSSSARKKDLRKRGNAPAPTARSKNDDAPPVKPLLNFDKSEADNDLDDIPDDDKWRMVEESGILKKLDLSEHQKPVALSVVATASLFFTVPLFLLMIMFEVLVGQQFSEDKDFVQLCRDKVTTALPALFVVVFLVHRFANTNIVQYGMLLASIVLGSRMMQLVLGTHTYGEMMSVPGIAVAWIYFIAQMQLLLACLSLVPVMGSVGWIVYSQPAFPNW
ncbi:hypothetical protein BC828DRAFT_375427 [Blastocladiella britannica]|nr:hypothetical protein BC828DRAFT_375427 [Blastocladiella britannica]